MIKKLDQYLENFAKWSILFCVLSMLLLSLSSIVLRWFEMSLLWIDPLVRHLVFVAAFLGGSLATGANQHIKIDLLSRLLEKSQNLKLKKFIEALVLLITFIACFVLVKGSYQLTLVEFEYGKEEFLGLHSGYLVGIIPVGMGLIALRVMTQLFLRLKE